MVETVDLFDGMRIAEEYRAVYLSAPQLGCHSNKLRTVAQEHQNLNTYTVIIYYV